MDRKVAKEFLHIRDWLDRAGDIVSRGEDAYAADGLLQEAGGSHTPWSTSAGCRAAIHQVMRAPAPLPGADLTLELWAG